MKNQIILWLCSIVMMFLIGYIKNVTDKDYPVTGTFGIEGRKVSYKLDKQSFDKQFYKNIVISDIAVKGKLIWFKDGEQHDTMFKETGRGLEAEIPILKPGKKINYKLLLAYAGNTFEIPKKDFVTLTFWGNIPSPVNIINFILLYSGLLLTIRCVLELFDKNKNLKKYMVIGCTLFITLTILIHPLYKSYKLGVINKNIPHITQLLEPSYLIIMFLWVIGAVLIFNKKYVSTVTVFVSFVTILIYFLL
jgi:hypothetical protein